MVFHIDRADNSHSKREHRHPSHHSSEPKMMDNRRRGQTLKYWTQGL